MSADDFRYFLKGFITSWTNWMGFALMTMPEWFPLVGPELTDLLDQYSNARTRDIVLMIMGTAIVLVRTFRTNQSLVEKGKGNA